MNGIREIDIKREAVHASRVNTAPAWLVALCRIILWLTKDSVKSTIKAASAVVCVALTAALAGGIGVGAVPIGIGLLICLSLLGIAFLLTGEFC